MEVKERMGSKIVKLTTASVRIVILTMVLVLASSSWSVLGFTIDRDVTVGQMFLLENNRVWPTGVPYIYAEPCNLLSGYPDPDWQIYCSGEPHEWQAEYFRQALHRLIDRDEIAALYPDPIKKAKRWLPEGTPGLWNKPRLRLPTCDRMLAVELLDAAGFVQGTELNPDYDPIEPWSAEYIRIDPISGLHLDEMTYTYYPACGDPVTITGIEYYTIGPAESPLGFEMATMITEWWRTAGIPVDLVAGTWLGMTARLINYVLEDYQIMTDFSVSWDVAPLPTPPYILRDFTYSKNLPLWNFVYMNYSCPDDGVFCDPPPVNPYEYATNRDADYWGLEMLNTPPSPQNLQYLKHTAHQIQEVLSTHEPYLPLLEWMYE